MAGISPSRRVRKTPFSEAVEAAGVKGYTVYNHMLLPTFFETVEADCHHLKRHVQLWDVSCERQISIKGPDARKLVQLMTPRDLNNLSTDRCFYAPVVDQNGGMINDPVLLRPAEDEFWFSIADSDLSLWASALASAYSFEVEVTEPDVSPLAVQGPRADDLMARVFGDEIRDLGFFRCRYLPFEGQNFLVARSGWSKQGGFEIYVAGTEYGMSLWNALESAGKDLNVRAGCPNNIERIESGLLSYGSDMTRENSPFECGLGKYVNDSQLDNCIGGDALANERDKGTQRMVRPLELSGEIGPCTSVWPLVAGGKEVGKIASAVFSPDFAINVAIGMVDQSHWDAGTKIEVETEYGVRSATVKDKFWN